MIETHDKKTWEKVKLTEICRPKQWTTISSKLLEDTGYPVFGANGVIGFYHEYTHAEPTILITCRGATCGTINLSLPKSYVTGNAMALDHLDESRVSKNYLIHFLTYRGLEDVISGSAQPQITRTNLSRVEFDIPPLEEQRRIAEILDLADGLRAKRRAALAEVEQLTQAVFFEMFESRHLPKVMLGELAEVQGGLQVSRKRERLPIQVPYLRVANVYRGQLELGEIKSLRVTASELERVSLVHGDLLLVEGHGNSKEVGRCAMWEAQIQDCVHQNHLIRVRCGEELLPEYTSFAINSIAGRAYFEKAGKTTSGLNTISTSQVRGFKLPVPPLELQREFRQRVQAIKNLKASHQRSLAEMDALFASLQSRAFKGEL